MTIAKVDQGAGVFWLTATANATSVSKAFAVSVTAGSLLVACIAVGVNEVLTVSDNNGNTWVSEYISVYNGNFASRTAIAYAKNANAGATTVTLSSASFTTRSLAIIELTGANTTAPADGSSSSTVSGSSHTPNAGNIITSGAGITIAGSNIYTSYPITAGSGYSIIEFDFPGTGEYAIQDQIWPGAGTRSTSFGSTETYSANVAAAFLEAVAGGGIAIPVLTRQYRERWA